MSCVHAHTHTHTHTTHTTHMIRSHDELIPCLVDEEEKFVDDDWKVLAEVKTVEPVEEFAEG